MSEFYGTGNVSQKNQKNFFEKKRELQLSKAVKKYCLFWAFKKKFFKELYNVAVKLLTQIVNTFYLLLTSWLKQN